MNDLNRHKKSDKIKWTLTAMAFLLVAIMVVGLCLQCFGTGKQKPSEWFKKEEAEVPAENVTYETALPQNGGMTMPEKVEDGEEDEESGIKSNGIALMSLAIPVSQYAAYGIPSAAERAKEVTATVSPDNEASNTKIKWELAWKNPASEWATGKDIQTYVTLTTNADDLMESKKCTVSCLEPFGEQIELKAVAVEDEAKFATVNVDYVQQVKSVSVSIGDVSVNLGGNTDITIKIRANEGGRGGKVSVTPTLGDVYTIKSNFTAAASLTNPKNNSLYYVQNNKDGDPENVYVTRLTYNMDENIIEDSIYFDRRLFTQFNFYACEKAGLTPNLPRDTDELFTTVNPQAAVLAEIFREDKNKAFNGPFKNKVIWTMKVSLTSGEYEYNYESDLVWAAIDETVPMVDVQITTPGSGGDLMFP